MAMDVALEVYHLAARFSSADGYRLTGQLARAIVSVPANITEGRERSNAKDFATLLRLPGSLMEREMFRTFAARITS